MQGAQVVASRLSRRALLVFDFDGTLWRGNEPLEAYAELVSLGLDPAERGAFLADVRAFLRGDHWLVTGLRPPPDDGWAAIATFAADRGAAPVHRQAAFHETRRRIAAGEFRLEVPRGLPEFLAAARDSCVIALASNSPAASVHPVLERLGLAPYFDEVASDAGKPGGLPAIVDGWIGVWRPAHVMSIGDHYRNDIEPAARRGWFTTHISPWRWIPGPCSIAGATVEDVLPALRSWVGAAAVAPDEPQGNSAPDLGHRSTTRPAPAIPGTRVGPGSPEQPEKEVYRTA